MAIGKDGAVGRQLRTLFNVGAIRELSDGQLLERFATDRSEASELAFAALVERHGSMVLRVCRGVLDDPHDSQDAFQATFLVLVTKSRGLWVRDSLGPWLHQVAYRTALCARSAAARRNRLERRAAMSKREEGRDEAVDDLERVLLEEIERLPERFRVPVVLCDLEGRTHEQAARALGWPVGTVKSRQARARDRLRSRLVRRGLAPGAGLVLASEGLAASLPPALVNSTTIAAVRFLASRAIVPGSAAFLAQEVIRSMTILRWWKAASVVLALGAAGSGVGLLAQEGKPGVAPKPEAKAQAGAAREDDSETVAVKPGKLSITFIEGGVVEPSSSLDVINEVEGNTTIIMIKPEGTRIQKGEVVAELDSASLRDMLINQKITIQQAEASYKQAQLVREVSEFALMEYRDGILPKQRESLEGKAQQAQSAIHKAVTRLVRTRLARQRMDGVLKPGRETPSDIAADLEVADRLDEAELNISEQKLNLVLAKNEQEVLEKFTSQKTVKQLTGEIDRARSEELRNQSGWRLEQSKEKKLERQILRCTLRAPGDGLLVYGNDPNRFPNRAQIEEGATVRERQLLFRVVDPDGPMRINTKVHESLVDRVVPGMKARIKVDAFPDQDLLGSVISVAPLPDANARFAENKKLHTTFVQIDNRPPGLRPGLTARVKILVGELDNVLTVPISSVVRFEGKYLVEVKTPEGPFEWREVELGRTDDKVYEVKNGIRIGELVNLHPADQLTGVLKRNPPKPAKAPDPPR